MPIPAKVTLLACGKFRITLSLFGPFRWNPMYCIRAEAPVMFTITDEPAGALITRSLAFQSCDADTLNTFWPAL